LIRACVIGWPIEHSRSPLIHNYWLRQYAIDGSYEKIAVPPEELETFLEDLRESGFAGANVTLPHKEAALRAADIAEDAAKAIGAANTLWLDAEGRLCAGNSDAFGFIENLKTEAPEWQAGMRPVTVLGAGGAARAVVYALLAEGADEIRLTNRSRERADALAYDFGAPVHSVDWDARHAALADCGLLVNATSLGMTGLPPLEINLAELPVDAVVADIVYTPLQTELLAAAHLRGSRAVDGLGMLLHQAVPGFERWFGVRPAVTPELRAEIAASLRSP
jgi:shikimate dehydrogenase